MSYASMAGFECETLDEVDVPKGTPSIIASGTMQNNHETASLRMGDNATPPEVKQGHGDITTGSQHYITCGFYVKFDNVSPASTMTFFGINEAGQGIGSRSHMRLELTTAGELQIRSNSGATAAGGTALAANTWYLVEIELDIDTGLNGACTVYLDEQQEVSISAGDFYAAGTTTEIRWKGSTVGASSQAYNIGSFYLKEDGSSMPDRVGEYVVLQYNYDENTATPNVTGDDLDASTDWENSSEIPGSDVNHSEYTLMNSGVVETSYDGNNRIAGPKGDSRRNGNHQCATWTYRAGPGAGFGLNTTFQFKYGAGDGSDGTTATANQAINATTVYRILDAGSNMPTGEEYFQYGFAHVMGKPIRLLDCWCHLLVAANPGQHIGKGVNRFTANGRGQ